MKSTRRIDGTFGFCCGCGNFGVPLFEVRFDRYRCLGCTEKEQRGETTQYNTEKGEAHVGNEKA